LDGPDLLTRRIPIVILFRQFDPATTIQNAVESTRKHLEDEMADDIGMRENVEIVQGRRIVC
jgi:hypothetical protein